MAAKRDFTAYEFVERKGAYLHIRCAPGRTPGSKAELREFAQQHAPTGYTAVHHSTSMTSKVFVYWLKPEPGFPEIANSGGRGSLPDYV